MAISSIGSYVTTADEFIAHWSDVDGDRLANSLTALTLQGGFSLAGFTNDRDDLQTAITGLEGLENARDLAAGDRDLQKQNLRTRLRQFRSAVELHLKQTSYFRARPTIPNRSTSESKFLRPFDDAADLWARIDADTDLPGFTPPLLLQAGYTLAGFTADLATMRSQYKAVTDAENDQDIARKQRDAMLDPLKERMLQYRVAIELEYGPGHPFFESLPEVTPAPGSTPDPVTASGQWDAVTDQAVITWTKSEAATLNHYEVRMTPGATYDTANNAVVGTAPVGTLELPTIAGLAVSGDVASFRVYVVLSTGNEVGSNTVTILRP